MDEPEQANKWSDRHEIVKIIKVSDPEFGWIHLVLGKRKKDGEFVLRLKRYKNWFTIPSQKSLFLIKTMLEKGAEELGWVTELSDEEIEKMIKSNEALKDVKDKSKKQIAHQKEIIEKLLQQVGQLRQQKLLISLDDFKKDIRELKSLLKQKSKEKKIQNWLYDHPWIFGPIYIEETKEEITRKGDRIDFLLQRYDTYFDVIELKLPTCKLFVGEEEEIPENDISRKYSMSFDLKNAVSQIIGYLETYEIDKTNILWEKGKSIHKPKGLIVIGRTEKINRRALKSLNSYLHDIEILTYDDMIEIGENFIKLIEKRNSTKIVSKSNEKSD
ncbi:MAG: DUF4263 domain-containing protein [Candidatus Aenigmarchaeota archaeon]|nr:DUF4263 domain-containing protein [Candidatus Aenigmarchaeota archaeon]